VVVQYSGEEGWSGYEEVGKRKHENSVVVELCKERARGSLLLGKVHTVLSKELVELGPVP
jgi:hypothetical protein